MVVNFFLDVLSFSFFYDVLQTPSGKKSYQKSGRQIEKECLNIPFDVESLI